MKKKTNVIDNIIWVLRSIFRFDHKYIFAMGTVTVITAICSPMSTLVSQSLMNSLQERRSLKMLLVLAAIYIGIDLFQMLIECFLDYYKYTFAQEYNLHLNQEVLKKSSRLNLKSFESSETYDMVSRAQYEADGKLLTYLDSLMGVFSSIITTVSYLLIIVRFRIWIMLCILIIPIVKFCINRKMNRETFKVIRERTNDSRKCWYMQHVLTYGEAYKELKIYNLFSHFIGRYREYKKQFNAEDLRLKKKSTVRLGGATVLETMIDGLIFAYIVFCGYTGEILIGNVVTYAHIVKLEEQIARALIIHQLLGNRISDTLTMRKDCLYKKDNQDMVIIHQPKSRRFEKPVSAEVAQLIKKAIVYAEQNYKESIYIFANKDNPQKPLNYQTLREKVIRMIYENDLRDDQGELFGFGSHLFRHTYGVKLTELHVDDWTISKLIGHKNVKSVKYYRKMSNQSMADETREARNYMSNVILANLDGWGEEYEQIR